jgi:hypothetical protein
MNPLTIANAVANGIVAVAVVDMAIRVFGNAKHRIHAHPELFYIRKFVSSLVICGAVLNVVTLSTPSWTEIVLNYGFAANYLFSSYYDRFTSPTNSKVSADVPQRRTPRRPSNTGKTKPHSAARSNGRKRPSAR